MRPAIAILLAGVLLSAQQNPVVVPAGTVKFESNVQLVVMDVTAKDKSGKPIENLTEKDFSITEDGKPQTIKVFKFQRLEEMVLPEATLLPRPTVAAQPAEAPAASGVKSLTANQIAPAKPGEVKYQDRRLMVMFFDMSSMPVADQIRAQTAALKFIKTQMTPSDLMAVMTFSTDLKVPQDFTDDRDQLTKVIRNLTVGDGSDLAADATTGADTEEDTGAAYTADDTEFTIFNTDRKMVALETAAKMLGSLSERKALIYFASGVERNGSNNDAQLRSTINAAIRNNVSFYPIDARGLVASAPMGDATTRSSGGQAMLSGGTARARQSRFQGQQDTLYALAEDTGGKALLDTNDLAMGIQQAQKDIASYYIVGYYSTNDKMDGRYRRIKLTASKELTARLGKLDYRSGYFAGKEFKQFTSTDKERQLQEALMLGDPVTDLTIAMEVNYFRMASDRYFVPITIKVPGTEFELAKHGGAEETKIDWIGEIKDGRGQVMGNVRDISNIKLKGETVGQLAKKSIAYSTGFTLAPGSYSLKVLARENISGKMGTYEQRFVIPDLNADSRRLPISAVVLSNQREDLSSAVYSAERNRRLLMTDPLVQDNKRLIPSVTRVFRKDQEMYVYLEAYEPHAETTQPIIATVTFFRGKTKAFETAPLQVTEGLNQSKAVPVRFSLPMATLQVGRYECQVSVLDPIAGKMNFWRAPVVVLP